MVNRRHEIAMSAAEVAAFVAERHTATLCTRNWDGSIHAVAMWYGFLEGQFAVHTKAKSQKARNLARDSSMTCLVQAGERYEELRGVELVGEAVPVADAEQLFTVGASVFDRYVAPYSDELRGAVEEMLQKRVAFVLAVRRTVSWDHRKLARASELSTGP